MMLLRILICILVIGALGERLPCKRGPNGEKMRELTQKLPKVECYIHVCIQVKENGERYDSSEPLDEDDEDEDEDDTDADADIDNSILGEGELESNCYDEDEHIKRRNKALRRRRKKYKNKHHESAEDKEEETDKEAIIEGDIRELKYEDETRRKKRNAIGYDATWPKGIVYYKISKEYTKEEKKYIIACLDDLTMRLASPRKDNTKKMRPCIRFKKYKEPKEKKENEEEGKEEKGGDYLDIKPGGGCSAFVGRLGKNQTVTLKAKGCLYQMGTVQHEIIHSLGFYHEHSRPDREEFIKIIWENIKTGFSSNFDVKRSARILVPYDYESVMHYKQNAFSKDPRYLRTIQPIQPKKEVGQRHGISKLDTAEIQILYGCPVTVDIDDERRGGNRTTPAPPKEPAKIKTLHCPVDPGRAKVPCAIRELSDPKLLKVESAGNGHYPKFERTTWNWLSGFYWYVDGDRVRDNDTVHLESEVIHPGDYCLQFSFWNYASMSSMRLYIEYIEYDTIFTQPDEQSWITPTIVFTARNRFILQFVITVDKTIVNSRFPSTAGDFCLDEIRLGKAVAGKCYY